jgi:hypothetical protein
MLDNHLKKGGEAIYELQSRSKEELNKQKASVQNLYVQG